MVYWWILGACLSNQRRKPQRMLIMDIRGMPIVWRSSTLQHFQLLNSRFAGLRRCMQARSHMNTQLPNADTDFSFLVREKGGFIRTLRTPWATCLGKHKSTCISVLRVGPIRKDDWLSEVFWLMPSLTDWELGIICDLADRSFHWWFIWFRKGSTIVSGLWIQCYWIAVDQHLELFDFKLLTNRGLQEIAHVHLWLFIH